MRYAIGQRVRYQLYGTGEPVTGEGVVVALPKDPPPNNYLARYRVRHDRDIEVGVLEGEITDVVG